MLAGENFGEFSYLDYLGEKTLVNSIFQINTEIKGSVKFSDAPIIGKISEIGLSATFLQHQ